MQTFNDAAIPMPLFHRLEQIGFEKPTPIQAEAIPLALEGADILGTAQTGTGKTGAFGIPLVTRLLDEKNDGTALVLLPTRELATQVLEALKQFIGNSKIASALLIGGDPMHKQLRQLKNNPKLIVGTPGRVNDHLLRRTLKLDKTNFLVLDEVDRMLDMGFGIQLDAIAKFLTAEKRQTLMFSATLPDNIQRIAKKYLTNPSRISVGSTHAPTLKIKQENIKLSDSEKQQRLLVELEARSGSIIVFVSTKRSADKLAIQLRKLGHKADAIHGDLRQHKRTRVISNFRDQKFRILVATDVAARGLDIPHIEHVINYNLPQCAEDYIHRIGRTGRAGAEGNALSLISPADNAKWHAINRLMNPDSADAKRGPRKPFKKGRSDFNRKNSRNSRRPGSGTGFGKSTGGFRSSERRPREEGGFKSDSAGGFPGFNKNSDSDGARTDRRPRRDGDFKKTGGGNGDFKSNNRRPRTASGGFKSSGSEGGSSSRPPRSAGGFKRSDNKAA